MEKNLYKGLRFVYDDYCTDYDVLLRRANMDSIELSREKSILCELYKCMNGQGPEYLQELFIINERQSRHGPNFKIPRVATTTFGLHSIRYFGPKIWNMLPNDYKTKGTLLQFKTALKDYKGTECKCSLCK
jgi:hypothetical protein